MIAELGHGGTADVYLAVSEGPSGTGFAKLAVVKKLRSHLAEDPDLVAMLMEEARICARLAHPNVVEVFEVGEDDGEPYLAMEHLDGQPLHRVAHRAARAESLRREHFYMIVADVLAGLHYAHELEDYDGTPLDVIHRDITPQNVFVTYHGTVKVVDFGVAKAARRSIETRHGLIKGKARYMSPEQARQEDVDRRTDVFAAGMMLWNAATRARFWSDVEDAQVLEEVARGNYDPSPRAVRSDVPEEIDAICRKALAFDREDRYGTADEMRADIMAFLGGSVPALRAELATAMQAMFVAERRRLGDVVERAVPRSQIRVDDLVSPRGFGALEVVRVNAPPLASLAPLALTRAADVSPRPDPRPRRKAPASSQKSARKPSQESSQEPARRRSRLLVRALPIVLSGLAAGGVAFVATHQVSPRVARARSTVVAYRHEFVPAARARAERAEADLVTLRSPTSTAADDADSALSEAATGEPRASVPAEAVTVTSHAAPVTSARLGVDQSDPWGDGERDR